MRKQAKPRQRYKGPSIPSMRARLEALGAEALALPESDPIRALGLEWYPLALAWCESLADRWGPYGATARGVVGAVAALSPQVSWSDQCRFLPGLLESVLVDGDRLSLPHPGFWRNRDRAARILAGAEPDSVLGGPKVRAFYRAIRGDRRAVVVDRHAAALALGFRQPRLAPGLLSAIQEAYTLAADALGMDPRALQSLLWCEHKALGTTGAEDAPLYCEPAGGPRSILSAGLGFSDDPLSAFYAGADSLPERDPGAPDPLALRALARQEALPF